MALNFPDSPSDGERSIQPNGVTYEWQAAKERWISVSTLEGDTVVLSTGMVASFATDVVDPAWLYCNGQVVDRVEYRQLFNKIGTTYGIGDGSTTFSLPDYRGFFLRAQDNGRGADPDAAGRNPPSANPAGAGGDAIGSEQDHEFRAHSHTTIQSDSPNVLAGGKGRAGANNNSSGTPDGQKTEVSGGLETRPKNIYVRYYIYSGRGLNAEFTGFDDRLDGYADTGFHDAYAGDLNAILRNSCYKFNTTDATNAPADMVSEGYITTNIDATGVYGNQIITGAFSVDDYKIWQRSLNNGTWTVWKLVVDGNNKKIGARVAGNGTSVFLSGLTVIKGATGIYDYTFGTALVGDKYVINVTAAFGASAVYGTYAGQTVSGFTIVLYNGAGAVIDFEHEVSITDFN